MGRVQSLSRHCARRRPSCPCFLQPVLVRVPRHLLSAQRLVCGLRSVSVSLLVSTATVPRRLWLLRVRGSARRDRCPGVQSGGRDSRAVRLSTCTDLPSGASGLVGSFLPGAPACWERSGGAQPGLSSLQLRPEEGEAAAETGGAAPEAEHTGHRQGGEQAGGPGHGQAPLPGPSDQRCLVRGPQFSPVPRGRHRSFL